MFHITYKKKLINVGFLLIYTIILIYDDRCDTSIIIYQYYSIIRVNPTRLIFLYGFSDGIIIIDVATSMIIIPSENPYKKINRVGFTLIIL